MDINQWLCVFSCFSFFGKKNWLLPSIRSHRAHRVCVCEWRERERRADTFNLMAFSGDQKKKGQTNINEEMEKKAAENKVVENELFRLKEKISHLAYYTNLSILFKKSLEHWHIGQEKWRETKRKKKNKNRKENEIHKSQGAFVFLSTGVVEHEHGWLICGTCVYDAMFVHILFHRF